MTTILILGGARSGKSRFAEAKACELSSTCTYIATAEASDEEMSSRISRHKSDRERLWQTNRWRTIECPLQLAHTINEQSASDGVVLVDCLTIWLSNLMHYELDVDNSIKELINTTNTAPGNLVFVSNEVGMGLVPDSPLGREFRDHQGRLNQMMAEACERVEFIVAGLPLTLKI